MDEGKIALLIATFLLGGIFSGIGAIIKTQNAGDMISGYRTNKYGKKW